jgi:4-amino-4-deoxy-L-arabinose transferase-like glycosyltransferase
LQDVHRHAPLDVLTRPIWFAPILLALSAALSYMYADRNMPVPDEGALLTAAVKILHGGVFYRDVDAYAFPGTTYLLAGAMSLFGEHLSVARAIAGSFYCATVLGVYACAIALVDQKRAALCGLSLLAIKFFAFPIYTMFFYADASVAAAILALALFLGHAFDRASPRLFWVGVLTGLSIVTKQSTGIYVAAVFAMVLCFPGFAHGPVRRGGRLAELMVYGSGLLVVVGSMSAYFASQGVFADMIRGGLLRPFTGYLPTSGVSFLPPLAWWKFGELRSEGPIYFSQLYLELILQWTQPGDLLRTLYERIGEFASRVLYSAIPIIYAGCAWQWLRAFRPPSPGGHGNALARARFFTAAGASLAITLSAFPRADFIHIITVYPAVVLILFALGRPSLLGFGWRQRAAATIQPDRRLRFETAFVVLLLTTTTFLAVRYDATLSHRLSIDRADLWVRPRDAWLEQLVGYIHEHVPEGEPLFVYGHEAHWYYLSDRYTPRVFSQLYPGMMGDETGAELSNLIRETRPRVIAQGVLRWPGTPSVPDYTQELQATLRELYLLAPRAIRYPPNPRILRLWRLRK